jgi:hypothetical protein
MADGSEQFGRYLVVGEAVDISSMIAAMRANWAKCVRCGAGLDPEQRGPKRVDGEGTVCNACFYGDLAEHLQQDMPGTRSASLKAIDDVVLTSASQQCYYCQKPVDPNQELEGTHYMHGSRVHGDCYPKAIAEELAKHGVPHKL